MAQSFPPDQVEAFIARCPDAALVTLRPDGRPHVARIEIAVVDGRVRSTGAADLVRIRNLRRDPHCSLFVYDEHRWWIGLDGEGSVLEGPAAGPALLRLLRLRHRGTPEAWVTAHDDDLGADRLMTESDYLARVEAAGLLAVDVEITRTYGNLPPHSDGSDES